MKKFEVTSETKTGRLGQTLYRIKSCISFVTVSGYEVKKGDFGGWVEKEDNLSQDGKAWIRDNAEVSDNAEICDNAEIFDNAKVFVNAVISGNAEVGGNARVFYNAKIRDSAKIFVNAEICDNAEICGSAEVWGNAKVWGNARIYDNAKICGSAEIYGKAKIYGNAVIYGNANVFDDAEICGDVEVCGDAVISKNAYIFSLKHLMCVSPFPINGHPVNLTMFRTKEGEINIQFDHNPVKSIDEFKAFIDTFCEISDRLALITIVELGKRCIDLTA